MSVLQKLTKSKTLKVFLIALVLVFSFQVSRPKAVVPLIGWAGAVLAGMAAETIVTMGVKAANKAVIKKQAENYAENMALQGKFDFPGTNPYLNKDGSITLTPSANDRAKMAGLIAGGLTVLAFEDWANGDPVACPMPAGRNAVQALPGGTGAYSGFIEQMPYIKAYWVETTTGRTYAVDSSVTGVRLITYNTTSTEPVYLGSAGLNANLIQPGFYVVRSGVNERVAYAAFDKADKVKFASLKNDLLVAGTLGAVLNSCGDMVIPSTVTDVYPAPMGMSSTYQMPNHAQLANNPITIYNVMPPVAEGREITWAELDKYYADNQLNIDDVMAENMNNYLIKGDYITNPYTVDDINNKYTDKNYDLKVEDFNPPLEVETPDPPAVTPDPGEVGELDHSMWQVMRDTYNYLDDGIDTALSSMKGITDSAQGITTYLGSAMGWLPPEWRAVFTSAFVLGVFAHFLRR